MRAAQAWHLMKQQEDEEKTFRLTEQYAPSQPQPQRLDAHRSLVWDLAAT
jgi:hypothetical protein